MTTARGELAATVRGMLAAEAGMAEHELDEDVPLDQLGIDSLDVLKVAARFEQEFDVLIGTRDIESVRTLGDIVDQLGAKLAA